MERKVGGSRGLCLSASSLGCSLKSVQTVSQSTDSVAKKYSAVEWGELPLPQARSSKLLGGWRATSRLCPEQRCAVGAGGAAATISPMPQTQMLTCGLTEAGEALGGERDCTKMLFTPGSQRMRRSFSSALSPLSRKVSIRSPKPSPPAVRPPGSSRSPSAILPRCPAMVCAL